MGFAKATLRDRIGESNRSISPRPHEGMKIDRVTGLTDAQTATLKALGATEQRE